MSLPGKIYTKGTLTMNNNEAMLFRQPTADSLNCALVSIIIPAYNTATYIHRAIESSLRQTHKNVEVLVIDDGSSDDTIKVAQAYASRDERIRVFHQDNAGVSAARNHGIREAHGEYLYFLDSDDWLEDDAVETLLEAQAKYPDKFIVSTYSKVITEGDHFRRIPFNRKSIPSHAMSIEEFTEHFCGIGKLKGFHSNCAKMYRADCGLTFREDIHYSEDGIYTFEYLHKFSGVYYISKPVLNVFISQDSLTRSSSYNHTMLQSQIDAYDVLDSMANEEDTRKMLNISRVIFVLIPLKWALERKAPRSEILKAREAVKPYIRDYMSCKKISLKNKVFTFCKIYLPVPIAIAIIRLWNVIKTPESEFRKGEVIPYW